MLQNAPLPFYSAAPTGIFPQIYHVRQVAMRLSGRHWWVVAGRHRVACVLNAVKMHGDDDLIEWQAASEVIP